jgi:carboxypeptidase C (cathepsin A)
MNPEPVKAATDPNLIKRQQDAVDALLARPEASSKGQIRQGRQTLSYEVRSSFLPVTDQTLDGAGAPALAAICTTAYLKTTDNDKSAMPRPVCFAFNGGPGSASIWLHLGALGPKRVVINNDGTAPTAPYSVVDNPDTWLEHFDLVFIDPAHTGWSLGASDEARKQLLSVDGDVKSLVEVIRTWLTRHQRWGSPLYLAGESYGTTRGAALADSLQEAGIALSGLILISCAMDIQALSFDPGNDLPYPLYLPALACSSQYHGLLPGPLGKSAKAACAAAQEFADGDYLIALHAGGRLSTKAFAQTAKRLSELTGLSAALIEEHNLRITDNTYFVEALRAQGKIVGRLDSRVLAAMGAKRSRVMDFDPGIEAIAAPYAMAAQAYYAQTLGVQLEHAYQTINFAAHNKWHWNRGEATGNQYACTTPDLARAMRRNPHLKVLVASGRYDLGTPYSATDWSLAQLDITAHDRRRITHHYYDAGHMMYTRHADLTQMKVDLAAWLKGA